MKQNLETNTVSKSNFKKTVHMPWFYEEELHRLIELDTYLRAEKDEFRQSPLHYWLRAECDYFN